jgi:formylglycine-generating enzyme required for sulfatase activity
VTLTRPFWLGITPATRAAFHATVGHDPSQWPGDPAVHPVECVTRELAVDFCRRLSEADPGQEYRLPTEAEWEWACRAGLPLPSPYHTGRELPAGAVVRGGSNRTAPVGAFGPNAWGLLDLHGNVWEWTADLFGERSGRPCVDPRSPSRGATGVLKGGSWFDDATRARTAYRHAIHTGATGSAVGVRVACSANNPPAGKRGEFRQRK